MNKYVFYKTFFKLIIFVLHEEASYKCATHAPSPCHACPIVGHVEHF